MKSVVVFALLFAVVTASWSIDYYSGSTECKGDHKSISGKTGKCEAAYNPETGEAMPSK